MRLTDDATLASLHAQAGADRWGVSTGRFGLVLERSCTHRFGPKADAVSREDLGRYLVSLNLPDLALATACRDGSAAAWDHYVREVHPTIRSFARSMAGDEGIDLADEVLADLYGTKTDAGERRSLFDYYHGRSRLTTWLRSVLAQRRVDGIRSARRTESLDGRPPAGRPGYEPRSNDQIIAPDQGRLVSTFEQELAQAVAELPAGDRLRLSLYHVHSLTLAEVGRIVGEHESSVSRKLDRARTKVRQQVEAALRERHGFQDGDIRQCLDLVSRTGSLDVVTLLGEGRG